MEELTSEATGCGLQLCDFIDARRSEIAWVWRQRVPAASALQAELLEILEYLARHVRGDDARPGVRALECLGGEQGPRQVTSELTTLRDVILELWERQVDSAISIKDVQRLNRAFDEVIAARLGEDRGRSGCLEALLSVHPDFMYTLDREQRFTYVSPSLLKLWGRTLEEAVGKRFEDLGYAPELVEKHRKELDQVLAGKTVREENAYSSEHKTGYYEYIFAPILGEDGSVRAIAGITRDITERKETADALLATSEQLKAIHDAAPSGIITVDERGDIESVNPAMGRIFGYRPEELVGRNVQLLRPPGARRLEEAAGGIHEVQGLRRDGTVFPLEVSLTETRVRGQRKVTGLLRNISERKRIELEREETLALLDTLIATAPVGLSFVDRNLRYVRANDALAAINGVPLNQTLGRPLREVIPELAPRVEPIYQQVFDTGEAALNVDVVGSTNARGAEPRHWLVSYYPVKDPTGHVFMVGSVVVDVTDLKRAEAEVRRRAEFEQQLIGIVSHDLRNPLHVIGLSASTLLRHPERLDSRALRGLARIQAGAQRASRLIATLLDFTQARFGGGIPAKPEPADPHGLTRKVVDEVQAAFPERRIAFEHRGSGEARLDPDRIAQLLQNLIINALKYSPGETPVTVRSLVEEEQVVLEVHNLGPPISAEVMPRLFQPMQRGARGTTGDRSLGLGLYIVDQIVRAHRGSIEVKSTPEEGTLFRVRLPRRG